MPATGQQASQNFVPIADIRDGVAVLKGGGLRLLLIVSSINFALKSTDEQQSILLQYQNFLNSLDFPIEIFVQSRELDIKPYIMALSDYEREQGNELLKIQTKEYINFVKDFTDKTDIMTKNFFVVVPYDPPVLQSSNSWLKKLWPGRGEPQTPELAFEEKRSQLEQRVGVVQQGLNSVGLRSAPLGTEELVELFFKMFNPGETEPPVTQ